MLADFKSMWHPPKHLRYSLSNGETRACSLTRYESSYPHPRWAYFSVPHWKSRSCDCKQQRRWNRPDIKKARRPLNCAVHSLSQHRSRIGVFKIGKFLFDWTALSTKHLSTRTRNLPKVQLSTWVSRTLWLKIWTKCFLKPLKRSQASSKRRLRRVPREWTARKPGQWPSANLKIWLGLQTSSEI